MVFKVVYPELQRLCQLFLQSVKTEKEKLVLINFSSNFPSTIDGHNTNLTIKVIGSIKLLNNNDIYGLGTVKVKNDNDYYIYTGEWTNGTLTVFTLVNNNFIFNGSKIITNRFEKAVGLVERTGSNIEMFKDDIFKTSKVIYNNDIITHIPIKMELYQSDELYLISFPIVLGANYMLSTLFDTNYDIVIDCKIYNKLNYKLDKVDSFTLFNGFDISYLICNYNKKDQYISHIINKDKVVIITKNLIDNTTKHEQIRLTRGPIDYIQFNFTKTVL